MPIIKCKMCGGDLNITEDSSVCECEYCGTKQTVPKVDDEKKLKLFERANRLRTACEFDKAAGVYESIVADFDEEAEAYWGLILCKFGIEYVDDPATGNKVPTCHRSSFDSLMDDPNFDMVMECADPVARRVYRDEAKQIEELRKRIIEVSVKEEPYDVFISYKELDDDGQRTLDSVIAQDIYTELTGKGYRVFFSRISLEDKLGVEYEPYIFAALNSAKVMLVVGTDYDYFNAVWVRNEWSRFLALIAKGEKKTLIPVFKSIDAYDMPKEFRKLAALDMGKVGAMQDLIRGVEKIVGKKTAELMYDIPINRPNVSAIMERGNMALEDGEWERAKSFFDQILNIDAHNADAYLGLAMAEAEVFRAEELFARFTEDNSTLKASKNISRARQFSSSIDAIFADAAAGAAIKKEREREQRVHFRNKWAWTDGRLSVSNLSTAAVLQNGTVAVVGNPYSGRCETSQWKKIIKVSAGINHTLGLRGDGSVVSTPLRAGVDCGQCDVSEWKNIISISTTGFHSVGLRSDGTVISTRFRGDPKNNHGQCEVSTWRNIISVSASLFATVGLRRDGTVVAVGDDRNGRVSGVSAWKDIIAISAGSDHILGLRSDGTVVASGKGGFGQSAVSGWSNIVAISAGYYHSVGLRADGTVLSTRVTGDMARDYGQSDVSRWENIVAISAAAYHTVGLRSDGSVVSTKIRVSSGKENGQDDVNGMQIFEKNKYMDLFSANSTSENCNPERVEQVFLEIMDLDQTDKRFYLADALASDKVTEEEYHKLIEILGL